METSINKAITIYPALKILLLILLSGNMMGCTQQGNGKQPVKDMASMPAFDILLSDTSTKFNTAKIPNGKPVVLFFLGPNCTYCDTIIHTIISRIDTLRDIQFLLLSVAYFYDVKAYEEKYQLNKYDNIVLGLDYDNIFSTYYGIDRIPFLVIYGKEKRMKRANLGPLPADTIRAIIDK